MRRLLPVLVVSLALLFTFPAYGADDKATQGAAKAPEQIASQVKDLLTRERIGNVFDLFWRLRQAGVTWQPQLCAPNDLAGKLNDGQLRMYAGLKLFDAVYAATFMQRKAVAEAVEAIEKTQERLNLRNYADIGGKYFTTLKKAAAEPESVNVQQLLDQVAEDYARDVPALMSSPQTAEYLLDALYGFTVEQWHVMGYFFGLDRDFRLKLNMVLFEQPDRKEWSQTLHGLFKIFDRMNESVPVEGGTVNKVKFVEQAIAAQKMYNSLDTADQQRAAWLEIAAQYEAIRKAILTPAAK